MQETTDVIAREHGMPAQHFAAARRILATGQFLRAFTQARGSRGGGTKAATRRMLRIFNGDALPDQRERVIQIRMHGRQSSTARADFPQH